MASKFVKSAKRSLDLPVAGLAALSAGFVIFSLPADLLEGMVGATGIANFVAAAQPPLGNTARIGLSLAAAVAAFGLVYFLLRLIDRRPAEREPEEAEEEAPAPRRRRIVEESEPPVEPAGIRLRRWDAHPDAPARRPIFAVSDIGEPEPPRSPLATKPKKADPTPPASPFWEPDDFPAADPEEAESWMDQQEKGEEEQPLELSSPVPPPPPMPRAEVEPEPEAEPQPEPEPEPEPQPVAEQPVPEPVAGNESIAELMARLERGLSRRNERKPIEAAPEPEPAAPLQPLAFAAPGDDRLKSAIDNLQRIASRGL